MPGFQPNPPTAAGTADILEDSSGNLFPIGTVDDGSLLQRSGFAIIGAPASTASGPSGISSTGVSFGDGSMGAITFDGTTSPTNWTRSGSTYTYTGTLPINYTTVTFSADNLLINPAGWQIRCRKWNPTERSGIKPTTNGAAGSGTTAGTGASPSALWTNVPTGAQFFGGMQGANGVTGNANGSNAATMTTGAIRHGGTGGRGGRARATGISTILTAGNGGGSTANAAFNYYGHPRLMMSLLQPFVTAGTAIAQIGGGTGGGSGAVGTTGSSGAGGGGGGDLFVAAAEAWFGTGCGFEVVGGKGGNAVVTGIEEGGGGAGGGGGLVEVIIGTLRGANLPYVSAAGGVGGDASGNAGAWAEGGNGGDGGKAYLTVGTNLVGGTPTLSAAGGTAGANAGSNQTGGVGFVGAVAGTAGTTMYTEG